ncbi:hypothetical protein QBC47DRAFT_389035 [Echria macrotheca]|uniref:GST N-terminal domain-containing protein n=1 Tax=Echria macrotheca TaxID=438768 RepID=A0AAJ0F8Z4_9PEZI|nr:hypothetical protein QBC47DRAFT_389035 [Echria macrotheca]
MASSGQIVLFDLASKPPGGTWSLNPWKTRLLLNYKGLDYRTEWLEYPEIKPRLEGHLEPNTDGFPYTIPTVILPDGSYVMDSRAILDRITALKPTPTLPVESPAHAWLERNYGPIMTRLRGVYMPLVPRLLLNEASVGYWAATRPQAAGMPLDELERREGGDVAWNGVAPYLKEVVTMLGENPDGPFFAGREVGYADFWWGGLLLFMDRLGVLDELVAASGEHGSRHRDLLEGLRPWSERCTY